MALRYTVLLTVAIVLSALGSEASAQTFGRSNGAGSQGFGGGSGFGAGGFGGSGFGGSGGGGGFLVSQDSFQIDQSASTGFVGRDSEDTRQFFSALEGAQQNFLENLGLQPRNERANSRQNSRAPLVRISLKVAFARPAVHSTTTRDAITSRIALSLRDRVTTPQVAVSGRTVVLSGQTATEYEKMVAEKLILLEPGVTRVENRLVVSP